MSEESRHRFVMSTISTDDTRRLVEISRQESLELLASVTFGRIVLPVTLPAIRPVTHLVGRRARSSSAPACLPALSTTPSASPTTRRWSTVGRPMDLGSGYRFTATPLNTWRR